jgi:tetratricopeptide (TPR) repeat protein
MIGRDEQLREARAFIGRAIEAASSANVLFVTGEAGIGKSTLLEMIRRDCESMIPAPLIGLTACSTPLAGQDIGAVEALEPWAAIMAQLASDTSRPNETRRIVAELAMAWVRVIPVVGDVLESVADTAKIVRRHSSDRREPAAPGAASQQQLFQQYINVLSELSQRTPLVLMLDDAHWADASSTNLLFAAARQLAGRPVVFLVAYRPDDAASSRGGEGHPILHVRNELERYDMAREIGVPSMTPHDLDALLRDRYPNYRNDDAFEEWIARVSGGNALFITQFLRTLEEDSMIDPERGEIRAGFERIRVPASAQAVVQERIRRLDEETRELLRYASVEGDTFTSLVLGRITEMPQLKLLQRLRLAEERNGFVRALGKQRVYQRETSAWQFSHALLHKTIYDDLLEEERELLHAAVLDVLKEELETARVEGVNLAGVAARVALHAEVLGELELAATVLLDGALATWKEYAAEETLHLLEGAFGLLDRLDAKSSGSDGERVRLRGQGLNLRASVHRMRGRLDESLADSTAARDLLAGTLHVRSFIDALNDIASIHRMRHEHDETAAVATLALEAAREAGYWEGETRALTTLGHIQANRGTTARALEWYQRSLEVAQREAPGSAHEATALDNIGSMYSGMGDPAIAQEYFTRSMAILEKAGDEKGRADVQLNIGVLQFETGDLDGAAESFEKCLVIYRAVGDLQSEGMVLNNLGSVHFHRERIEPALAALRRSLEISRIIGDQRAEASALDNIGLIEDRSGDREAARATMLEALGIHESIGNVAGMVITLHNLAWQRRHVGEFVVAREYLDRALALANETGQRDLIGNVYTEMGLLAEAEAATLEPDAAAEARRSAIELLRNAAAILRELNNPRLKDAEDAIGRLDVGS